MRSIEGFKTGVWSVSLRDGGEYLRPKALSFGRVRSTIQAIRFARRRKTPVFFPIKPGPRGGLRYPASLMDTVPVSRRENWQSAQGIYPRLRLTVIKIKTNKNTAVTLSSIRPYRFIRRGILFLCLLSAPIFPCILRRERFCLIQLYCGNPAIGVLNRRRTASSAVLTE